MSTGVRLAVDVGTVRVGVAGSDPRGLLASPLTALRRGADDLDQLVELVRERSAIEVVVGLPSTLAGRAGPSVEMARSYGTELAGRIAPVPVRYVDERLTSVIAEQQIRSSRNSRSRRSAKAGARDRVSGRVDALAAAGILQTYLDSLSREDDS
ncbi:MAG TPA: Holliday junction resolvase RuvX [Frankiaceae bacterium]|nr:Holliday junction resolvase RuvX [Frankiaceae bacterium]